MPHRLAVHLQGFALSGRPAKSKPAKVTRAVIRVLALGSSCRRLVYTADDKPYEHKNREASPAGS